MSGPGYGWCCACEGEISPSNPIVVFLPFQAPEGFRGWGCMACHLPARGAIAVMCQDCVAAEKVPRFVATGVNVGDNMRVSLEGYLQIPFLHDLRLHPELKQPSRGFRGRRGLQ
jgi:hypothetical protein